MITQTSKKTLVLGASPNPSRYAYMAVHRLLDHGHEVVPMGIKKGEVAGKPIINGLPEMDDIDTVTLYVGPRHQAAYYDYIISLNPKRVIFNPGTENQEFEDLLEEHQIETEIACTLVMLSTDQF